MEINLNNYTITELRNLQNQYPTTEIDGFIIVPLNKTHLSGFSCIKLVWLNRFQILGSTYGYIDILHLNGIGGYGDIFSPEDKTQRIDWKIDVLKRSRCVRIFVSTCYLKLPDFFGSDLPIYVKNK